MMRTQTDAANALIERWARKAPATVPATFGEAIEAGWSSAGLETIGGLRSYDTDVVNDLVAGLETLSGRPFAELANEAIAAGQIGPGWQLNPEQRRATAEAIAATIYDPENRLQDLRDTRLAAARRKQRAEADAAETLQRTVGVTNNTAAFLAGLSRTMADPVNLSAAALTANPALGIGRMLVTEAAIGAGIETVQQPFVQKMRAEAGLEAGFARGAENVLYGAVGQAGLAGIFRGGAVALRAARGMPRVGSPAEALVKALDAAEPVLQRRSPLPVTGRVAPATGRFGPASWSTPATRTDIYPLVADLSPKDFEAAARWAEGREVLEAAADLADPRAVQSFHAAIDAAQARMEARLGNLIDLIPEKPAPAGPRWQRLLDDVVPKATISRSAKPQTLKQFVVDIGKINDSTGEVRGMIVRTKAQRYDRVLSPDGQTLDFVRQAAVDAGFFDYFQKVGGGEPQVTTLDFLRVLDRDLRRGGIIRPADEALAEEFRRAAKIAATRDRVKPGLRALDKLADPDMPDDILNRAAAIIADDPEINTVDVLERAIMEDYYGNSEGFILRERDFDPPGWDDAKTPDNLPETDAGRSPPQRGADARNGERPAAGSGGEAQPLGDAVRQAGGDQGRPQGVSLPDDPVRILSDDALADLPDMEIEIDGVSGRARDLIDAFDDDAVAATELRACFEGGLQ